MKTNEIILRDPFVLNDEGLYYLYGTRSETAWSRACGFDVYVSHDLKEWTKTEDIFKKTDDFWATRNYWAPECIKYKGRYYLASTFGSDSRKKGVQILCSDSAKGPFTPLTEAPLTPEDWECLDGTLYVDEENCVYLIFSHSIPEVKEGAVCIVKLSQDLKDTEGSVKILFYAKDAGWTRPIPFAKKEFGIDGEAYFSDGPYIYRNKDGALCMLWSSWGEQGYSMGISKSISGKIDGPWGHEEKPFKVNGGHGMVFTDNDDKKFLTYHSPNDKLKEHPVFEQLE